MCPQNMIPVFPDPPNKYILLPSSIEASLCSSLGEGILPSRKEIGPSQERRFAASEAHISPARMQVNVRQVLIVLMVMTFFSSDSENILARGVESLTVSGRPRRCNFVSVRDSTLHRRTSTLVP